MSKNITIPLSLLEGIFRLLDGYGDFDDLDFHKRGYNPIYDHASFFWELKYKIQRLQRRLVEMYLLTVGDATEDERIALQEWITDGNSIYDNPYALNDESGRLMDFINGCRIGDDMRENPSEYTHVETNANTDSEWNDVLPF